MSWSVRFTKQAQKDARKLAAASPALKAKAQQLQIAADMDITEALFADLNVNANSLN